MHTLKMNGMGKSSDGHDRFEDGLVGAYQGTLALIDIVVNFRTPTIHKSKFL